MVFGIDDKSILGIDAPSLSNNAARSSRSITLNLLAHVTINKQKLEALSLDEPSNNIILLADSIWDSITVLAQALIALLKPIPAPALPTPVPAPALVLNAAPQPAIQNGFSECQVLWERIALIDAHLTEVQTKIEAQMRDITSMLDRIFAIIRVDKTMALGWVIRGGKRGSKSFMVY